LAGWEFKKPQEIVYNETSSREKFSIFPVSAIGKDSESVLEFDKRLGVISTIVSIRHFFIVKSPVDINPVFISEHIVS